MKPFLGGIIFTLAIVAPVVLLLLRRIRRHAREDRARRSDIDQELARLTGELAHEIKNPLSTIKVNLKLTKEALEDMGPTGSRPTTADQRAHTLSRALRKITVIQKETDRLDQVVEGFLRYVRRTDLQLATVDLNELVGDMVDFYSPQAHGHALTLRHCLTDKPLVARVDPGALKQVLLNLFINAQQAMTEGGELMVRTERRGHCGIVQVSDTGSGIPPEKLASIFRPYQSSRSGGTGLGLATAKKIVESHRGAISVHSEVGKGTSFTIELPLAGGDAEASEVEQ